MYASHIHDTIAQLAQIIPAFLLAFSFHEFAHALVAVSLGDPTPRIQGRLTMNPLVHIDPIGFLFLIVMRIGWGKPVEFNKDNFKHPRLYSVLTALAGPFSNYLMAFFCILLVKLIPLNHLPPAVTISLAQILKYCIYINIMLGTFNLLPIPPLDGSHVVTTFLAESHPHIVEWMYRYSLFILIGLFFLVPGTQQVLVKAIHLIQTFLFSLVF